MQAVDKAWFEKKTQQDDNTKPKVVLLNPQVDFHCNEMDFHPDNPDELGLSISTRKATNMRRSIQKNNHSIFEPDNPNEFGVDLWAERRRKDDELGLNPFTRNSKTLFQGSLAVVGADQDSERIAKMIHENVASIDEIFVTMDTRYKIHIAHAISWTRGYFKVNTTERTMKWNGEPYEKGERPQPFTEITNRDVVDGVWIPGPHLDAGWCQEYTYKLELGGKFKLMIWPEHCLIGTLGHSVVPVISEALTKWSKYHRKTVDYVRIGQNIRTETYSVFKAEVEDPAEVKDPTVHGSTFNHNLMSKLKLADKLLVCGQALTHVVNFTFRDLVTHFDDMKV